MTQLLPPWPLFWAFMAASLALAITPGPGVIYIVTRSATGGRRRGIASVLGVATGNLVNAVAAALGLGALLAVSATAFAFVKYAGAAYLIWLGLRMLLVAPATARGGVPADLPVARVWREGFLVAALNPKTTLFFAAFLPQFLGASEHALAGTLLLGALFVVIAAITDSCYALAAGALAPALSASGASRWGARAGGGICIGLGLMAALTGTRSVR